MQTSMKQSGTVNATPIGYHKRRTQRQTQPSTDFGAIKPLEILECNDPDSATQHQEVDLPLQQQDTLVSGSQEFRAVG